MCGIAGFTHLKHRADAAWIREATRSLIHRGPDEQDTYQTDTVSLGAVRLRVIDPEHGHQPLRSEDGNFAIVFNGEIYNNTQLREELRALGHKFDSRCDTETVLRAFIQWDTDCFRRLRGMFALAIWTENRRRLVLARDRMGIKPLYISHLGDDLIFGSELKALFAHPKVSRNISQCGLHNYLSLNYVPAPDTMVEGIDKLRPAHWLEWREGRTHTEAYWQLEFRPDRRITLDAAKDQLDLLLRSSVQEHMVADVPLGLWSSGGVDSSTILHYASQATSTRLKTFSISFAGRSFDESPFFREMAARYSTDHHELDVNPEMDLQGAIEDMAFYSDEPGADAGALPVWYLSRLTRSHVTVALSGDGADEIFGGYQTYLADDYAAKLRMVPSAARRLAVILSNQLPVSDEKISFEYKVKRMLAGSFLSPREAHLFWNGTFSEADKEKLHLHNGHIPTEHSLRSIGDNSGKLNPYLWLDQNYYLPDNILYKCDRMSMAHSLEVRPPFLDHRIVEFAATLPENLKVRGSKLKYVLRELMKDKLPASILNRSKQGFDIPAHHWLRTSLRPLLLDTLTRRAVEESGLFQWKFVESMINGHLKRRANLGYHLWGLLVLFLWMKKWGIRAHSGVEDTRELHSIYATT